MSERGEVPQRTGDVKSTMLVAAKALIGLLALLATFLASPLSGVMRQHWLPAILTFALVVTLYALFQKERELRRGGAVVGIVGVFSKREGLKTDMVLKEVQAAKSIDMMGYNLRSPWLSNKSDFDEVIRQRLKTEKDLRLRILIADPDSTGLKSRELQERHGVQSGRMKAIGDDVLMYLDVLFKLKVGDQFQVRLIDANEIRCSTILVGDMGFVTIYLSESTGNKCPGLILRGTETPLLGRFRVEFDEVWARATPYVPPA